MTTVSNLTCIYRANPLGIDAMVPRLSWQIESNRRGARQTAYQVCAAAEPGAQPVWDTGKVMSDQSVHLSYAGPALSSGQRVYWQVRVWDEEDAASEWSAPAFWEMGLLNSADWSAQWITPDWDEDTTQSQPQPVLRRAFNLTGAVKSARAYVTSLGLYELHLNGARVGDGLLTPGWTSYDTRLQYQTYDVTALLQPGENAIGAMLGDGWYRGFMGFSGNRNTYGDRLALLLQLVVTYTDGSTAVITSDGAWQAAIGPVQMSDIYNGEIYDARAETPGWDAAGYDAAAWRGVRILDQDKSMLIAQSGPAIIRNEEIKPRAIIHTPAGETVVDFGQNMVGWVRLTVSGPAGTIVTLTHAEVLDQQGNFYITNLRLAKQLAQYTLKGNGVETWEPCFTFMGFQFVKVEGFPGELTLDTLTGIVVHSDIPSTGSFECSNPMINQLQHNIVWGQEGNFVDVPTDCPQRDERLGWTGDAQVFIRTACFNRDVAGFFTKWLRDLAAEQNDQGSVPMVIPDPMGRPKKSPGAGFPSGGSSAWADAAVICPWTIYLCYGDKGILAQQYESMKGWVGYMRREAGGTYLWTTGFHFGDWLDFRGRGEMNAAPITDKALIASAFFAYSTSLLQQAAVVLGKTEDAAKYQAMHDEYLANFKHQLAIVTQSTGGYIPPGLDNPMDGMDWENATGGIYPFEVFSADNPLVLATVNKIRKFTYQEGITTYAENAMKFKTMIETNGADWSQPRKALLHHYEIFNVLEPMLVLGMDREAITDFYSFLLHSGSTQSGFEYDLWAWRDRFPHDDYPPHGWCAARYNEFLRNMLVREDTQTSQLHLASALSPLWLQKGKEIRVENAPTDFGSVSYQIKSASTGAEVAIQTNWRQAPSELVFHVPWFLEATSVKADGKSITVKDRQVKIPSTTRHLSLTWKWTKHPDLSYETAVKLFLGKYWNLQRGISMPNFDSRWIFPESEK